MIEQILKHFISEDAKLVIAALEKSMEVPQRKYAYHTYLGEMCTNAREHLGWVDATVIRKVQDRVKSTRGKEEALRSVRDVSAKILMGETFEDKSVVTGSPSAMAGLTQAMAQAQQAAHGQQLLGNPYGYSDLMRQGHASKAAK